MRNTLMLLLALGCMFMLHSYAGAESFEDLYGNEVSFVKPSWVNGQMIGSMYEGQGIYVVYYNSGWQVRVNRLGVVWRADKPHYEPQVIEVIVEKEVLVEERLQEPEVGKERAVTPLFLYISLLFNLSGVYLLIRLYRRIKESETAEEILHRLSKDAPHLAAKEVGATYTIRD